MFPALFGGLKTLGGSLFSGIGGGGGGFLNSLLGNAQQIRNEVRSQSQIASNTGQTGDNSRMNDQAAENGLANTARANEAEMRRASVMSSLMTLRNYNDAVNTIHTEGSKKIADMAR